VIARSAQLDRLVAALAAEADVVGRDAGAGPELPVGEPAHRLGLDLGAALGDQPDPAVEGVGEAGDGVEGAGGRRRAHGVVGAARQEGGVGDAVVVDGTDDDPADVDAEPGTEIEVVHGRHPTQADMFEELVRLEQL
jgi:hypothetical protein